MELRIERKNLVMKIPRSLILRDCVERFIERIELETRIKKSGMAESEAWQLSEEIKKDWWEENKAKVLKRIRN